MRIEWRWTTAVCTAAAAFGLAAGYSSPAHADIPDANGVYTGCYTSTTGHLRVIDYEEGERCRLFERMVTWSGSE